jgi:hypothetical protein
MSTRKPNIRPENLLDLSIDDVCSFIDDFNFNEEGISKLFRDNNVNGPILFGITAEELKEMDIASLGKRQKIIF